MALRVFVTLLVFVTSYAAWFGFWVLLPADLGMPDYEHELETAAQVGTVAFVLVPIFLSVQVGRVLERRRTALDS